eukprot:GDKH01003689.1.p3 GENE.GDKH01003689.1~~GDKH01003689.1.p3  ORF type:complete len:65 (-),score=0.57 GDKH01003689.1:207-401(-)
MGVNRFSPHATLSATEHAQQLGVSTTCCVNKRHSRWVASAHQVAALYRHLLRGFYTSTLPDAAS